MSIEYLRVAEALAQDIPWPDVYFSPGYGAAMEASDGGRWEVAVGAGGAILSPYVLRPVDPALTGGEELWDAVSPYGYAGTWTAPGLPLETIAAFRRELRASQSRRGVVAEFLRLGGPLPGSTALRHADPDADAKAHNDTIDLLLTGTYETYWTRAHGRHRTSVRKARKVGLQWEEGAATAADLAPDGGFRALYEATMQRVDARPYYFFPDAYYDRLLDALGPNLRLAKVRDDRGALVASALFMRWGDRLHYHLAGSERMAARAGANNLLLDGMIAWGYDHGITSLHLGAGLTADDALFKFKVQFGGERRPFWLLRTVLDPQRYDALVRARAAQTDRSAEQLLASGYFPAYRA